MAARSQGRREKRCSGASVPTGAGSGANVAGDAGADTAGRVDAVLLPASILGRLALAEGDGGAWVDGSGARSGREFAGSREAISVLRGGAARDGADCALLVVAGRELDWTDELTWAGGRGWRVRGAA